MSKETPCDQERLIAQMRAGDVAALDGMMRCYGDRLVAIGRRCCRTEQEAEDAVQDALMQASAHMQDFRGEGSPLAWLSTIVANRCRRFQRGRRNDPALHTPIESAQCVFEGLTPEAEVVRQELSAQLHAALMQLNRTDRLLVLLAAEGWTGPELSAEFGLSPAAIRSRLSRSRKRLSQIKLSHSPP